MILEPTHHCYVTKCNPTDSCHECVAKAQHAKDIQWLREHNSVRNERYKGSLFLNAQDWLELQESVK